ncbi:MAG: hypothetical protein JJU12_07000 [Chlamydiales bacterium]|nr:hypothetical protein [Chlamydiales bacterium]
MYNIKAYNSSVLDKLNEISQSSRDLPPKEKSKIDQCIVDSMQLLEINQALACKLLEEQQDSLSKMEKRANRLLESSTSRTPKPKEPSLLKRSCQTLEGSLKELTEEKDRSMEEKGADLLEQALTFPLKEKRDELSKKVKDTFGPRKVTNLAFKASDKAYRVARKAEIIEENELFEAAVTMNNTRKKLVEEAANCIKAPGRTMRKYIYNTST